MIEIRIKDMQDAARLTELIQITKQNIDVMRRTAKDPKSCEMAFLVSVIRHMPEAFERLKNLAEQNPIIGPKSELILPPGARTTKPKVE